jgi:hypothetical protein
VLTLTVGNNVAPDTKNILIAFSILLLLILVVGLCISTPDRLSWIRYKEVGPLTEGKRSFKIFIKEDFSNWYTVEPYSIRDDERIIVPWFGEEHIEIPSRTMMYSNLPFEVSVTDTNVLLTKRSRLFPKKEGFSIVHVIFPTIRYTESIKVEVYRKDSVLDVKEIQLIFAP